MSTLVIDAANVVGSRPDGWWRDRPGAARRLHERVLVADLPHDVVVLVLEGAAKAGVPAGRDGHVLTVHASRDGDSRIVEAAGEAAGGAPVTVVTADRLLRSRVEGRGALAVGPGWLLDQL